MLVATLHSSVSDRFDVPVLKTDRFTMRPLRRSDTQALFDTFSNAEDMRFLTHPPFDTEEALWHWLTEPGWEGRTWIATDSRGKVVGRFVACPTDREDIEEIGFVTVRGRRNKGVARECMSYLIAYLFDEEAKFSVIAEVDVENRASISLLEQMRFERTNFRPRKEQTHAGERDVINYVLMASTTTAYHQ